MFGGDINDFQVKQTKCISILWRLATVFSIQRLPNGQISNDEVPNL